MLSTQVPGVNEILLKNNFKKPQLYLELVCGVIQKLIHQIEK